MVILEIIPEKVQTKEEELEVDGKVSTWISIILKKEEHEITIVVEEEPLRYALSFASYEKGLFESSNIKETGVEDNLVYFLATKVSLVADPMGGIHKVLTFDNEREEVARIHVDDKQIKTIRLGLGMSPEEQSFIKNFLS